MARLYFSINKDETGKLCDEIFYSKTKTNAKDELRDRGLTPKLVLTWDDVEKIKTNEYVNKDVTEEYQQFVLGRTDQWEVKKKELEQN